MTKFDSVKDSGQRQSFNTGAVRDTQDGKPRYDLIPATALKRLAIHYANGAKKYGDRNWEKGIPASRCLASTMRHLFDWVLGDRSEDHLSAVLFNIMAIIHWEETSNLSMQDNLGPPRNLNNLLPVIKERRSFGIFGRRKNEWGDPYGD